MTYTDGSYKLLVNSYNLDTNSYKAIAEDLDGAGPSLAIGL